MINNAKKITFATNVGPDTLSHTKLLLKSLKENLENDYHEILVFIDKDTDGVLEYLRSIKNEFKDLTIITHKVIPVLGPEINSNLIIKMAKHDIVSYLQNDMVISKNYDTEILKHLEENMILSSTRIEPPLHSPSDTTFTMNFGLSPEEFKWDEFLSYANTIKSDKLIDYFFAPFTVHKQTWDKLGGYDTIFRRSRCDSDIVQRALHLGIKIKQTYNANVYHFTCVSSRGKNWFDINNEKAQKRVELQNLADQVEMRHFFRKWGSFNHIKKLPFKYDIDFVVKGDLYELIKLAYDIEPFGSRMWVSTHEIKEKILDKIKSEHNYANELYGFELDDWDKSKEYYNKTNYDKIYFVGEPTDYNVKITINSTQNIGTFLEYIFHLTKILKENAAGQYELGDVQIDIKKLVEVVPFLQVNNPIIKSKILNLE
jgi:GT2 family glycosyltransferase